MSGTELVVRRMSYEDCAREAEKSRVRHERAARKAAKRALMEIPGIPTGGGDGIFKGASGGRSVADWVTFGLQSDDELRYNIRFLRSRARDLARNNPYIKQFLTLLAASVIGPNGFDHCAKVLSKAAPERAFPPALAAAMKPGMNGSANGVSPGNAAPKPKKSKKASPPLNEVLNEMLEEKFADWSRIVTVDRRHSLNAASWLGLKAGATDGELFVRMVNGYPNKYGFALQFVDSDLIDETYNVSRDEGGVEVRLGVEVDQWGGPLAYFVLDRPIVGGMTQNRKRTRVAAYNPITHKGEMLHLYLPTRIGQTRAPTWFAAIMVALKMLSGYEEAELFAARAGAAKMGFIKTQEGSAGDIVDTDGEQDNPSMEATPGSIERLMPGTEFQAWDPTHPTSQYPDFVKSILRSVATGLAVSYNALCNDLEGVNYSSMRSGLLIERDQWAMLQEWWRSGFLLPIYRRWLEMGNLTGELKLPTDDFDKLSAVAFTGRGWMWVDPQKDTTATIDGIGSGLSSRTRALAEQGIAFEDILDELEEEQRLAEERGVKIDAKPEQPPNPFGANPGVGDGTPPKKAESPNGASPPGAPAKKPAPRF
jgi:lambda family phage portal protein